MLETLKSSIAFICVLGMGVACTESQSTSQAPDTTDRSADSPDSPDTAPVADATGVADAAGVADATRAADSGDTAGVADAVDTGEVLDHGGDAAGDVDGTVVDRLPPGVYRIDSLVADAPTTDLQVLGSIVGEATIVGLGEAYHQSGGYLQGRARLIPYLVEELGFRSVAIEDPWAQTELVDAYLQSDCSGSASDAVKAGLRPLWWAQSVAGLVEWLCQFNQTHGADPVVFFGMDISQPEHDVAALTQFTSQVEAPDAGAWATDLGRCEQPYHISPPPVIDPADDAACMAALDAIETWFDDNEDNVVAVSSTTELEWAHVSIISLRASQQRMALDTAPENYTTAWGARDVGMYGVLKASWKLRAPDSKLIVFASNAHIARAQEAITIPEYGGLVFGALSVGSYLAADHGDAYVSLNQTSHETQTTGGAAPVLSDPSAATVILHALGEPYLLVDLEVTDLFEAGVPYLFGASGLAYSAVPRDQHEIIFYMDSSPAPSPLF